MPTVREVPTVTISPKCHYKSQLLLEVPIVTGNTNCHWKSQRYREVPTVTEIPNCYWKSQLSLEVPTVSGSPNCHGHVMPQAYGSWTPVHNGPKLAGPLRSFHLTRVVWSCLALTLAREREETLTLAREREETISTPRTARGSCRAGTTSSHRSLAILPPLGHCCLRELWTQHWSISGRWSGKKR